LGRWEKDLEMCADIIDQEIENLLIKLKGRQAKEQVYSDGAVTAVAV
jgi:hypothetical protein